MQLTVMAADPVPRKIQDRIGPAYKSPAFDQDPRYQDNNDRRNKQNILDDALCSLRSLRSHGLRGSHKDPLSFHN